VDSLNPDFLDPCIAEVEPQLMLALWALLKPQQSGAPFGAKALQMLGKLGGRSRRGQIRTVLVFHASSTML
jgi:transformation/transcription domain-associated protein